MGSRAWIKVHCERWLEGTLRQDSPELRGVWIGLLALAGSGRYGDTGEVKLASDMGMTDSQIAAILSVDEEVWSRAKGRLVETERISVSEGNVIRIRNWSKYQSEYRRQKPYRDARRLQARVTADGYSEKERRLIKRKKREEEGDEGHESALPVSSLRGFDGFWKVYSPKVDRRGAEKAWHDLSPDEPLVARIIAEAERDMALQQECGIQSLLSPAIWLINRLWLEPSERNARETA